MSDGSYVYVHWCKAMPGVVIRLGRAGEPLALGYWEGRGLAWKDMCLRCWYMKGQTLCKQSFHRKLSPQLREVENTLFSSQYIK